MQGRRAEEGAGGFDALLEAELARAVPAPSGDLVGRTLARARDRVLMGDVLRFLALEGLWMRQEARDRGADSTGARQDR